MTASNIPHWNEEREDFCSANIRDRIMKKLWKKHLRWEGHIIRADVNSLAKINLYNEVHSTSRKGRPKKREENLNSTGGQMYDQKM